MKYLKKTLKILFTILAIGVLILILAWFNLSTILKPTLLSKIQTYLAPSLHIPWEEIDLQVENDGWLAKKITLKGKNFCIQSESFHICTKNLEASATLAPLVAKNGAKNRLIIHSLVYLGKESVIQLLQPSPSEDKESLDLQSLKEGVREALETLKTNAKKLPDDLQVTLSNFRIKDDSTAWKLNSNLTLKGLDLDIADMTEGAADAEGQKLQVKFHGDFNPSLKKLEIIEGSLEASQSNLKINSTLQVQTKENPKIIIKTKATFDDSSQPNAQEPNHASFNVSLNLIADKDIIIVDTIRAKFEPHLHSILSEDCKIDYSRSPIFIATMDCPETKIELGKNLDKQKKDLAKAKFSSQILLDFNGGIRRDLLDTHGTKLGFAKIKLATLRNNLLKIDGDAHLEFERSAQKIQFIPKSFDIAAELQSFEKLAQVSQSMGYPFPSIVNAMKGSAQFRANLKGIEADVAKFAIQGNTHFTGPQEQKLNTKMNGFFDYVLRGEAQKNKLSLEMLIDDLVIYLPDFSPLQGLPNVGADARISDGKARPTSAKASSKPPPPIAIDFSVSTTKKDSIKIYYYLVKPFVPIRFAGTLKNSVFHYDLSVEKPFTVEYLRRKIKVENFSLQPDNKNQEDINLKGSIAYQASSYLVHLDLLGTLSEPALSLKSTPSLPQADIISVLLYNRTQAELSGGENKSVGGAESAITDKALGLVGIWAFASTPIKSFYYDSSTGTYRAQVELPGGVDLDIGTDWENSQTIGLRKQIWGNWMLVTGFKSGGDEGQVGNIFLQKEWSYE